MAAQAMILAAGRGERMRPLSDTCPKPLLEVNGKPLIVHHLQKLASQGVKEVVVNIAWLRNQIRDSIGNGEQYGLQVMYSDEGDKALETLGGIAKALPSLEQQFWVVNADIYTDFAFNQISLGNYFAHLILVSNPDFNPQGDFGVENGKLLSRAPTQHTFSGIGFYDKAFFMGQTACKKPLAPLIRSHAQNGKVAAQLHHGFWSDVGTPHRLQQLQHSKI